MMRPTIGHLKRRHSTSGVSASRGAGRLRFESPETRTLASRDRRAPSASARWKSAFWGMPKCGYPPRPALLCGVSDTILLYDGLCGFCDGVVQFVLAHDRRGTMQFAPLQGEFATGVMAAHPELHEIDSLVLVSGNGNERSVSVRSSAALDLARYLGGPWALARVLRLVPRPLADWCYDCFARHRYRLFARRASCRIPEPAIRSRFLA